MYNDLFQMGIEYINIVFMVFALVLFTLFSTIGYLSSRSSIHYRKKHSIGDISRLVDTPMAPSITIIAPAYNESLTIVDNVRSLLALRYAKYDIMVVNDGSRDDTLERLVEAYDLVKKPHAMDSEWPSKPIKGIYKSTNPSFSRLTVIDKVNGGKSDALNPGIHLSESKYLGCIDADCLMPPAALLHVVRAFFQRSRKRVIAVGGVLRVANSCKIDEGQLKEIRLPKSWLARFQLLEYTRSFLLGRMGWGRLDSLLIISGAFGFFDRQIAVDVGGFDTDTVGEDMEIVFRMRRHMHEKGLPYTIEYLPDPLCWTVVPENLKTLVNQRDRWSRGTLETLRRHRDMLFNPRFGRLGMLSYPYWFFYEWLSPLLEFFGFLTIILFWAMGILYFEFFLAITLAVYSFAVMFSLYAILWEVWSYNQYQRTKDVFLLIACAFLEPILFQPIVVWSSVQGNYKKLFRVPAGWGTQVRKGFAKA